MDPRIVANAVLRRAEHRGVALTNLDVQKIVYFLHGGFLRETGSALIDGEFQAWDFGPVHPVLYDAFKAHQDRPIDALARRFDPIRRQSVDLPKLDDRRVEDFLDSNLPHLFSIPTFKLVQITHMPGTPWSRTMEAATKRTNLGMVISNKVIAQHFEGEGVLRPAARQKSAA